MQGRRFIAGACGGLAGALFAASAIAAPTNRTLDAAALKALAEPHKVAVTRERFGGRDAVVLRPAPSGPSRDGDSFALLKGVPFADGEIEGDLAADVVPGSDDSIRAFVGLGFRGDAGRYEAFYLRMLNGRSPDQPQRNHAAQYISYPDFGWKRLRTETPGAYETYVDLAPGRWTHVRLVACGGQARLYVDRAAQPTLVINDLKLGPQAKGEVLLWIGPGTIGRFADLHVRPGVGCPLAAP